MGDFLEITTATNATDSLLRAGEHIGRVDSEGDPFLWKWIIICLHHSLYAFSIIAAAGTNRMNVTAFNENHREKMFKEIEGEKIPQYDWIADNIHAIPLIDFLTAVKHACARRQFVHSRSLELTRGQKNSILFLRDYRNKLEHFEPNNHSAIGLHGLPNMCVDALEITRFLALESDGHVGPVDMMDLLEKSLPLEGRNFYPPSRGAVPGEAKSNRNRVQESINSSIKVLKSSRFYGQEIDDHPRLSKWT